MTAAYLFIDAESKKLSYSAAGHPPALLWERSSDTTRFINENGLMLGLFPDAEYQATELTWNQGDRFLLYTDGVTEAENSQEVPFGTERLEQLRFLDHGVPIHVAETPYDTIGVDTEEDLRRAEKLLTNY